MIIFDGENTKSTCTNIDEKMEQPNAIDLRIDKVFKICNTPFMLSEEGKQMRDTIEIVPDDEGYFNFEEGCCYQVDFDNWVEIGEGEAGWIIPRSSLNRNGIFLKSGLYDSGFRSPSIGAVLYNQSSSAKIKKGTRIGQFLLFKAEMRHLYNGQYQS